MHFRSMQPICLQWRDHLIDTYIETEELKAELNRMWKELDDEGLSKFMASYNMVKLQHRALQNVMFVHRKKILPKKPRTCFILFCKENRPIVKTRMINAQSSDHTKELGRMWKSMSEEGKKKYKDMYEQDLARYKVRD